MALSHKVQGIIKRWILRGGVGQSVYIWASTALVSIPSFARGSRNTLTHTVRQWYLRTKGAIPGLIVFMIIVLTEVYFN